MSGYLSVFALASLGFCLIGCASATPPQPESAEYAPPRYGMMDNQFYARFISFRNDPQSPFRPGLWLDKEGTDKNGVAVILPLPDQKGLPTPKDWKEYFKIVYRYNNYGHTGTHPKIDAMLRRVKKIPMKQLVEQKLLGPPLRPNRIIGVALNNTQHMADMGMTDPQIAEFAEDPPRFFWKKTQAIGPFDPILVPVKHPANPSRIDAAYLDYEVELAFVVGKKIKRGDIKPGTDLSDILAGFLLGNDVSDREPQIWATANAGKPDEGTAHWPLTGKSKAWNKEVFDLFTEAKSQPGFAVLGPFLISPDKYDSLYAGALELWRRNNTGETFSVKQNGAPMYYQHDPKKILAAALEDPYLKLDELLPGDVIMMGTPAGTILKGSVLRKLIPEGFLYQAYQALAGNYLQPGNQVWAQMDMLGFQWNTVEKTPVKESQNDTTIAAK